MAKYKLEYIWLDGYEPVPNLRGKTQVKEFDEVSRSSKNFPMWGFDGSSTRQAEGHNSDCMLKPVAVLSRLHQEERRARHVRSHACPTARPRIRPMPAPPSWMIRTPGSASSRNTSSTRTARRSASRRAAVSRLRKANTTPASATRTWAISPARSWTRTSTSASTPASTTKASTPKWPRASGNSKSSAKAPRPPPTRCGWPATS